MIDHGPVLDRFAVRDKEKGYIYRWVQEKDLNMLTKHDQGYEVVRGDSELPPDIASALGQPVSNPGGGNVRKRGDTILMRIKEEVHAERVAKPREAARQRHVSVTADLAAQTNDKARAALRRAGYSDNQIREKMAFTEAVPSADAK